MPPRLKVFITSDGLTDFVVATTSKAKALASWGVRQDLFKEGVARQTDDPELVAAASAQPGEVLRRPASSRDRLATLKPAERRPEPKPKLKAEPPKPKGPSKATLQKIADLEAQLAALDRTHQAATAELERERVRLAQRAEALKADHAAQRRKLEAALSAARRAPG